MQIAKLKRFQHYLQQQLPYCALIIFLFAFNIFINRVFIKYSIATYEDWVPLLKDIFIKAPSYNESLLSYYSYIFSILSIYTLKKIIRLKESYGSNLSKFITNFSYFLVLLNIFLLVYVEKTTFTKWVGYPILFYTLIIFIINSGLIELISKILSTKLIYLTVLLATLFISGYLFISSWYPVYLPNDYQTITELVAKTDGGYLPKNKIVSCVDVDFKNKLYMYSNENLQLCENLNAKDLPLQAIKDSEKLNSGQDRILYHHSYVFIPALHIIKYGIFNKFPYLYGIGNTYFNSLLVRYSGNNITGYFNSYPIGQLIGIIVIFSLIGYLTKSLVAAVFGGLLIFFFLSKLGFENILLAPGFNPIRYFGVCLQIAALKYFSESNQKNNGLLLLITSIVSGIWNFEFFCLGALTLIVYLLATLQKNNIFNRIRLISALLGIILIIGLTTKYITGDYIQTMQLAILGLFTSLNGKELFILILEINLCLLILIILARKNFHDQEFYFRIAILFLGLLLFSKYLFYPHPLHLIASGIILTPLTLIFIDWKKINLLFKFSLLVFSMYISFTISNYKIDASNFINSNVKAFKVDYWKGLNEKFFSSMPEDEILMRVNLIREATNNTNRLLILSPYDHLISAFVNPKDYCGHFELNLNILTNTLINKVVNCVKKHPDTLVIYDDMLRVNCAISNFKIETNCKFYNVTKFGPISIYEALKPNLILQKKEGPLTFYKYKP